MGVGVGGGEGPFVGGTTVGILAEYGWAHRVTPLLSIFLHKNHRSRAREPGLPSTGGFWERPQHSGTGPATQKGRERICPATTSLPGRFAQAPPPLPRVQRDLGRDLGRGGPLALTSKAPRRTCSRTCSGPARRARAATSRSLRTRPQFPAPGARRGQSL